MLKSIRQHICFTAIMLIFFDALLIASLCIEVSRLWVKGEPWSSDAQEGEVTCVSQTVNQHDYLFLSLHGGFTHQGVVHDPDCVKCKASAKTTKPKPQTGEHQYYIMPTAAESAPSAKK